MASQLPESDGKVTASTAFNPEISNEVCYYVCTLHEMLAGDYCITTGAT